MNISFLTVRQSCSSRFWLFLTAVAVLTGPELAKSQTFTAGKGDLLAGFRKYDPAGSYELVVKLGNITNFIAIPAGNTVSITNYTGTQLSAAFSDYNNLKWSVFSTVDGLATPFAGYAVNTLWFTMPRESVGTQTVAPLRATSSSQNPVRNNIVGIRDNAVGMSGYIGAGANNTAWLVREPVGGTGGYTDFATFIENPFDGSVADFGGNLWAGNVENTTPASFTSPVASDLYQSVPSASTDPQNGTNSACYYVGYFTLNANGSMTFTRASSLPAAPVITSVTRTNTTTYVSFNTVNGSFSYRLYFTNSTGLTAPIANWPNTGTYFVTGDGSNKTLTNSTTDGNRFYRVGVQ